MLPTLVTHSGKFHCDEVFAFAVLRLALGLQAPGQDHILIRTRNPEPIAAATIVWDVGSEFDPARNRFDHHQRGAPIRADGTPFSSAGLIWQLYGERAVAALLGDASAFAPAIATQLDRSLVRRIDELDNGVSGTGTVQDDPLGLAALVGDFNPAWDSPDANGPTAGDAAFLAAATFADGVLRRLVETLRARHAAEAIVLAAHQAGDDPRILVLDRGMPWKGTVFDHHLPVLFTISPASNGNWMLDTMPPEPGSFDQRLPLPEAWAGAQVAAEQSAADPPAPVAPHTRRCAGPARTRDGALAMARKALTGTV